MRKKTSNLLVMIMIFIILGGFLENIYAAVGSIIKYQGLVDILRKDALRGESLIHTDKKLYVGDILRTKSNGYAKVLFVDNTKLEVYSNSRLKILSYLKDKNLKIRKGLVKFVVKKLNNLETFKIETNTSIIGIKGTSFWVYVLPFASIIYVEKGTVEVFNFIIKKRTYLKKGEYAIVFKKNMEKLTDIYSYNINFLKKIKFIDSFRKSNFDLITFIMRKDLYISSLKQNHYISEIVDQHLLMMKNNPKEKAENYNLLIKIELP